MRVHFIVLPGVYLLDLAGMADAFRSANRIAGRTVFDCHYHGVDPVASTSIGLPLADLEPLPTTLEDGAMVVLSGVTPMSGLQTSQATAIVSWLRRSIGERHRLVSICAGAFLAARAGLLDGRACTTHHEDCELLQRRHPRALVRNNRIFVVDGNVMTSAGVTAGIDLALHLIADYAGPVIATRVARALVVYVRRTGHDEQLSPWFAHRNHLHPIVHRAQDAIVGDPTNDWTLAAIADAAHTSVRHLTRLFREETDTTVVGYLRQIRVAIARERLATTDASIERVAEEAGFRSAHHLRRAWRRHENGSPSGGRAALKALL